MWNKIQKWGLLEQGFLYSVPWSGFNMIPRDDKNKISKFPPSLPRHGLNQYFRELPNILKSRSGHRLRVWAVQSISSSYVMRLNFCFLAVWNSKHRLLAMRSQQRVWKCILCFNAVAHWMHLKACLTGGKCWERWNHKWKLHVTCLFFIVALYFCF